MAPGQARPEDVLEPSETAEEATRRMLDAKKLSSKINYNVLAGLFDSSAAAPATTRCARRAVCDHMGHTRLRPRLLKKRSATS